MTGNGRSPLNTSPPGWWLARYYDEALPVPEDLTEEVIKGDEIGRLVNTLSVVSYTATIKRRLGSDASREELALDKKRARRTAWAFKQSLIGWAGSVPQLRMDEEVRIAGAQILWPQFKSEHDALIDTRLRLVATWALRSEHQIFGNRALVKLTNELNWVGYALRE